MTEAAPLDPDSPRASTAGSASIHAADLARLMPMHLVLGATARIISTGPTLRRLFPSDALIGETLFDAFEVLGPARIADAAGLRAHAGRKLRLAVRGDRNGGRGGRDGGGELSRLRMRGLSVPLGGGGFLVNLSFGVDVVPAVGLLRLDGSDFAPTDMAIELLYLAEANAAVTAEMRRLMERLERARRQAEDEARTDPLTGLRNRRALDSLLARLCREGAGFALLNIDLDGFKKVNDTLGHAAGDRVLVEMGGRLKAEITSRDFVARVGGDEFVVLLPGAAGTGRLRAIGEALLAALSRPFAIGEARCAVTASIGIATALAGEPADPAEILARADSGVYAAKKAGRDRVVMVAAPPAGAGAEGPAAAGRAGPAPACGPVARCGAVAGCPRL